MRIILEEARSPDRRYKARVVAESTSMSLIGGPAQFSLEIEPTQDSLIRRLLGRFFKREGTFLVYAFMNKTIHFDLGYVAGTIIDGISIHPDSDGLTVRIAKTTIMPFRECEEIRRFDYRGNELKSAD